MKLVLILPPSPWLISDRDQPFLGTLYLCSYLRSKGHQVQVCDLSGLSMESWFLPVGDVYGVTGVSPHFQYVQRIIEILKERDSKCKVIVGGVHASLLPNHVLARTKADYCVVGEGEVPMDLYLSNEDPRTIAGFVGREFSNRPAHPLKDLNSLPFPSREDVDYYDYLTPRTYKYLTTNRDASIMSGRGCPYRCAFCASYNLNQGKVRFRSSVNVYEELKYLKERFDVGMVNFVDDTFTLLPSRVLDLCNKISVLELKWYCLTRVDKANLSLFQTMKNSGCISVTYGFESGSNQMLKKMKKNTTVEQARDAIVKAKSAGLKIRGQLIVGFPGESVETVEETAEFIRNSPEVDAWGVHVFQVYPGTDVWCNSEAYGIPQYKAERLEFGHTIGKPGDELTDDQRIQDWFDYLRCVAGEHNIDKVVANV